MNQRILSVDVCKEIANKLPEQLIRRILDDCFNCPEERIVEILQEENEKFHRREMLTMEDMPEEDYFVYPCKDFYCTQENCFFYHTPRQQRRKSQYSIMPCKYIFRFNYWDFPFKCVKKELCKYAHTENEVKYHRNKRFLNAPKEIITQIEIPLSEDKTNLEILYESTREIEKEIENKRETLEKLKQKYHDIKNPFFSMESISLCGICRKNPYVFVNVPCGHPVCIDCKSQSVCSKCKVPCEIIKTN